MTLLCFIAEYGNCSTDIDIFRLQDQASELKEKWDKQIVDVSRSQVNKDLELQNLREGEEKLKLDIIQKKEDIER